MFRPASLLSDTTTIAPALIDRNALQNGSQTDSSTTSEIPALHKFLARNASGNDFDAFPTRPSLSTADQELVNRLSAREWISTIIFEANPAGVLDFKWIEIASSEGFFKFEPQSSTLWELLPRSTSESDSKNSDLDSDVEVTAALIQASSPASSIITQADAMDADDSDPKDVDNVQNLKWICRRSLRSRVLPKKAAPAQQVDSANILTSQRPELYRSRRVGD
ncbi:hypothetical protein B0H13DRAFT_2365190 [Mycena leptocephala]|nr:hypothetical protein B0H13DRAFT_2365190 [Mycena leptocephala]